MSQNCHRWGDWIKLRGWESWKGSYKRICSDCGQIEYEESHARTE